MRLQLRYSKEKEIVEKFNEAFGKYSRMYDNVRMSITFDPKTLPKYQVLYNYGLQIQKQFSSISGYDMTFVRRVNGQINYFIENHKGL